MNQSPLLQAIELHKAFDGEAVLEGVSLSVEEGQSAVVMGPSGTGKSVMLKHFVQLHRPDRGEVWVAGERIDQLRGDQLDRARRQMGYLFQGGALFDSMSVRENLAFVLERNTSLDAEARRERILETLEWVALAHTLDQYPAELSGGQKTRIALARAAVLRPRILLYDEPTTGLDPIAVRRVAQLIRRLQEERGITSITITHDLLLAELVSDSVCFLHAGRFVAKGTFAEVRQSEHPAAQTFFGRTR